MLISLDKIFCLDTNLPPFEIDDFDKELIALILNKIKLQVGGIIIFYFIFSERETGDPP